MEKFIPFLNTVIDFIYQLSSKLPVELFVFVGTLLEEVISPIPSPMVTTLAGSLAATQGKHMISTLIILSLIAGVSKTLGSLLFYVIGDKAEDVMIRKYGKYFGVTHSQIESIGTRLNHQSNQTLIMIGLRALPIVPALPVSLVAGLIKMNMRTYLVSTFIGYIFRSMLFIYFGYSGITAYHNLLEGIGKTETILQVVTVIAVAGFIAWMYYRRGKIKW